MGQKRRLWGWWLLVCGSVGACDQELVVPKGMKGETTPVIDGPREGFTGGGGADDETAPPARLPVATEPVFTSFGGAGAAGADADEAGASAGRAGALARGGMPAMAGMKSDAGSAAATEGSRVTAGMAQGGDAGAGGAGGEPSLPRAKPELLFSEYVEGSGSFKAVEIYAIAASSLEGCELETYSNGKLEPSRLALHGELEAKGVQVLCSSALAQLQPNACARSTNLIFNGDDALALSCAGERLDVIGQIGVDPGDSWGDGATLDHTLRRRCEVTTGRRDGSSAFEIDAGWLTLGVDTFSDLGGRQCTP